MYWCSNLCVRMPTVIASASCLGVVSCPDPTLSWGKGSGDYWVISWLCWVNSLDFGQASGIVPCHPRVHVNQWSRPYIMQACNQCSFKVNASDSTQPRNQSIVTRPFSSWEVGSGYETSSWVEGSMLVSFTVQFFICGGELTKSHCMCPEYW